METKHNSSGSSFLEVNLKILIKKVLKRKWFFALSIILCCTTAFLFLKTQVPTYEVSTTLLIDTKGKSTLLGPSKFVEGDISPTVKNKNLFNEKGILKSYSLIKQTVEELDFGISYYTGTWYRLKEQYGHFPFEVALNESGAQLYGVLFQVEMLSDDKFILSATADKFNVLNPSTNATREVEREFQFSETYSFGEAIEHNYFNFIIRKPEYEVSMNDFQDLELHFKVNSVESLTKSYILDGFRLIKLKSWEV